MRGRPGGPRYAGGCSEGGTCGRGADAARPVEDTHRSVSPAHSEQSSFKGGLPQPVAAPARHSRPIALPHTLRVPIIIWDQHTVIISFRELNIMSH